MKSEIIIDAGANIGNHSLYWLKECGAYQVHAFEPVKDTYAILRENVKINTCEECLITYNIALGEGGADTAVISHYDLGNIGGTQIKIVPNGDISVKSIDELKFEEKISLMKIDVEGFELKVIKGALQTIKKNKPYIMLESWERTHVIEKIIEILTAMDYQYKRISMIDYLFYI